MPLPFRTAVVCALAFSLCTSACTMLDDRPASAQQPVADTTARMVVDSGVTFAPIPYRKITIDSKEQLDSLRRHFGRRDSTYTAYRALTTLNRKDIQYFRLGDTVVIPDSIAEDLRAYSVFPAFYPGAVGIPKIIVVSNAMQSYACYEYGRLVYFAAANTGSERKPTLPGRYALNWRARMRVSSLNDQWKLPYTWNFHKYAGSAFHQFDMPGRPVSHSCVRQFRDDAEWLFHWGEGWKSDSSKQVIPFSGTPVVIIDVFDFTRKKGGPWSDLASNRDGLLTLPEQPLAVEEALIPISQIPREVRGGLPNRQRYVTAEDTLRARGIIRPGITLSASVNHNKLREERAARKAREKAREAEATQQQETAAPQQNNM